MISIRFVSSSNPGRNASGPLWISRPEIVAQNAHNTPNRPGRTGAGQFRVLCAFCRPPVTSLTWIIHTSANKEASRGV
jgi:hypothetical protein